MLIITDSSFLGLTLTFLLLALVPPANAEDERDETDPEIDLQNKSEVSAINQVITSSDYLVTKTHSTLSSKLEQTVQRLDYFFGDEKVYYETSETYLRWYIAVVFEEGGKLGYENDFKFKLDLPKTEKKLKLLIESDPQSEFRSDIEKDISNTPIESAEDRGVFTSLEKIIADTKKWEIKVSGGVKVDLPLDPYGRIRLSRSFDLQPWNLYIGENFSWFNTEGFASNTTFEFSRKLAENLLFRTNSQLIWKEVTDYIELNQTFSFYQTISDKHALAFDISIYAQDQFNTNNNDYRGQARFRQRIKGDWLFYQITPEALFKSDNNFNPNMLLTAGLEILFGGKHLNPPKDLQLEEN